MFKATYFGISLIVFIKSINAAAIQTPKLSISDDKFLELKANGSLILRSAMENSSNRLQQAIIFETILNAIRLQLPQPASNALSEISVKIYGDGIEHKFPPFLESVIQRIQTYFSIYKYTDTSQPLREKKKPPIEPFTNETLTLANEIDVNLTSVNYINANQNRTTSATPTATPTVENDINEDIEFIEIKNVK